MHEKSPRLCITPKDIAYILNVSLRQASRRYNQVKDAYGRLRHQELTVQEFADYYGLPVNEIYARMR
ncbi:hypothetical protein BC792_12046 [Sphingobacterium allocomposti]|uniref:Uncharacterized protein n=1 Tax=Sphingobacterium allocomposti TaxID=415956 RepID=A0A5S5D7N4_9SPHI|nr:hypothetical protein [Sphingobacterium composti Yoo et al. 2007 non Ten et al. 2007]TYP91338.1 hypothetical protein BC792_12046 [Sphingobacterium composti Yoo et al. 2007 non Ten et al. 2007]